MTKGNEFYAIGNGADCCIVVERIQGIRFAEPHRLRHHRKHNREIALYGFILNRLLKLAQDVYKRQG